MNDQDTKTIGATQGADRATVGQEGQPRLQRPMMTAIEHSVRDRRADAGRGGRRHRGDPLDGEAARAGSRRSTGSCSLLKIPFALPRVGPRVEHRLQPALPAARAWSIWNCFATTRSISTRLVRDAFPTRPRRATSAAASTPRRHRHVCRRSSTKPALKVWRQQPEAFFDEAVIDADGTMVETTRRVQSRASTSTTRASGVIIRCWFRWPTRANRCTSSIAAATGPATKVRQSISTGRSACAAGRISPRSSCEATPTSRRPRTSTAGMRTASRSSSASTRCPTCTKSPKTCPEGTGNGSSVA